MIVRTHPGWELTIYTGPDPYDIDNGNVDVEVELADGRRFGATFFTLRNIQKQMEQDRAAGTCGGGQYFSCRDLVVVRNVAPSTIEGAVESMIREGTIEGVFLPLDDVLGDAP